MIVLASLPTRIRDSPSVLQLNLVGLFRIDARPYGMGLAEARAGLALARAESDNAAQEVDRVGKLIEQSAASEQHFDQLETAAAVARAQVEQMEARVARAKRVKSAPRQSSMGAFTRLFDAVARVDNV